MRAPIRKHRAAGSTHPRTSALERRRSDAVAGRSLLPLLVGIVVILLAVGLFLRDSTDDEPNTPEVPPAEETASQTLAGEQSSPPSEQKAPTTVSELLTRRRTLRGRVMRDDGAPVAGATLTLTLADGAIETTRSDHDGEYLFTAVSGETGFLLCRTRRITVHFERLKLPAPDDTTPHNFVLSSWTCVPVFLRSPGGGTAIIDPRFQKFRPPLLPRLRVVVTRSPPVSPLPWEVSSSRASLAHGRFVSEMTGSGMCGLPAGSLGAVVLDDDGPVFVSLAVGRDVLETRPLNVDASENAEIEFRLTEDLLERIAGLRTEITVRLLDALSGEPVTAGRARLDFASLWGEWKQADDGGVVTLEGLGGGVHALVVEAEGFARVERPVDVPSAQTDDVASVELRLLPGVDVRGKVTDEWGEAVEGKIYVYRHSARELPPVLPQRVGVRINADGEFEATGLPGEGAVSLIVSSGDGTRVGFPPGVLQIGSGRRLLQVPATSPVIFQKERRSENPTAVCSVLDNNGTPVWSDVVPPGEIEDLRLAPGSYRVELRDHALAESTWRTVTIEVPPGGPSYYELP